MQVHDVLDRRCWPLLPNTDSLLVTEILRPVAKGNCLFPTGTPKSSSSLGDFGVDFVWC